MYIGVNNQAKKVSNAYIGVNGQAKQISKIYVGVNNQAKLAWENYSPYEKLPENVSFINLNASVFYKPETNYLNYIIPETNWYQIELISPFTQSLYSVLNEPFGGTLYITNGEFAFDEDGTITGGKSINTDDEVYYEAINLQEQKNFSIEKGTKDTLSTYKHFQVKLDNFYGPVLGRGSSYGKKILKLEKGQKIRLFWIDYGYDTKNPTFWGKALKMSFPDTNIQDIMFQQTLTNAHEFIGVDDTDFAPYHDKENENNQFISLSTSDHPFEEEANDGIITLKTDSRRRKFIDLDTTLSEFDVLGETLKKYGIYTQSQTVINSLTCQKLNLGCDQGQGTIGNYSLDLIFDFDNATSNQMVQISTHQSGILYEENVFPGCFRITPASIAIEG